MILLGAGVLNAFLGFSQLPIWAAELFQNSGLPPYVIVLGMIILYLFLGCIMDSLAMILITIPIFWPIIAALDFGLPVDDVKLWFGIITLMVVEIGLITPPVGLNVFVINSLAKDVPMIDTFRGVMPFLVSDMVRLTLVVVFPIVTLILRPCSADDAASDGAASRALLIWKDGRASACVVRRCCVPPARAASATFLGDVSYFSICPLPQCDPHHTFRQKSRSNLTSIASRG